ncbi:tRNA wybutosine-synthesizing protein like [Heracleum sosnowskyi]|uniref:tRNA wybutosine-synthesizing protein like n=1 Tax=Heracleum sosnowskyi TaxID=360622 RepID=A0AAD8HAA6_9APIA|nr:tRNA wybutosine-synthesizing protein like [Heracleum sosnowskyi]
MASFVPHLNGCDEYDTGALLLSQLLDESHVEDCDDERLTSVIRSLEAEIEPIMLIEDNDTFMELEWDDNLAEFCDNNWNGEHADVSNGQDCSTASSCDDDLDNYNWLELEDMNEFGGVGDYYYQYPQFINHDNVNTNYLEDTNYGSLWQDTDVLIM